MKDDDQGKSALEGYKLYGKAYNTFSKILQKALRKNDPHAALMNESIWTVTNWPHSFEKEELIRIYERTITMIEIGAALIKLLRN